MMKDNGKVNFHLFNSRIIYFQKKIWRNLLALNIKKIQGIFGEMFALTLSSSAVFLLQSRVSNFF